MLSTEGYNVTEVAKLSREVFGSKGVALWGERGGEPPKGRDSVTPSGPDRDSSTGGAYTELETSVL